MTARTEIPQSGEVARTAGGGFSPTSIHEINERCLELLAYAARLEPVAPFSLVFPVRDLLLQLTPELRMRAAARAFLLVNFEFGNVQWWTAIHKFPEKPFRGTAWRNPFPRRSAIPLARATLMLAWQLIRSDAKAARLALGVADEVAEIVGALQLTELDRLADRRHRHLEPRWADRPAVWRLMLSAALAPGSAELKRVDAYGLQLLTGDLLPITKPARAAEICRSRTVSPSPKN
jgi:hypothetical protein